MPETIVGGKGQVKFCIPLNACGMTALLLLCYICKECEPYLCDSQSKPPVLKLVLWDIGKFSREEE